VAETTTRVIRWGQKCLTLDREGGENSVPMRVRRIKAMRNFALVVFVAALVGCPALVCASNVNCTGTLTGVINGNVIVPHGASCTLGNPYLGAKVSGNVTVLQNASLTIEARQYPSTITGNVQATNCAFALLEGAVTVGGDVEIHQCKGESGFDGPGIKIGGNFKCHNNSAACDANLGEISGDLQIHNNTSSSPANVSLTEVHGNLQCQHNQPAPAAAWGADWVTGNMQGQCAAGLGFAWSDAPPTCAQLAALLAKVPYIVSIPTTNDNTLYAAVTSAVVTGKASTPSYCNVQLAYTAIGSPGSSAPLTSAAYGYGTDENQAIKIGIGLPLSGADMISCSANCGTPGVQGAWNGRLENLGGGGLVGNVGSTTSATNFGYVGSSTDTGHTSAQNGSAAGGGNFGVTGNYVPANAYVPTTPADTLDVGKIDDYIIEGIHEQVEWTKLISRIYYGQKWAYNYWNGCSTGGRQGLQLAQDYGDEFNGFITGAPAIYHDQFRLSDSWPYIVNLDDLVDAGYPPLTTPLWNATTAVVVAACQSQNSFASSGATGFLDDPRACTASANLNICGALTAEASPNCLTSEQAAAIDKIWAGPHNGHDNSGNRIWFPVGKGVTGGVVSFTSEGFFGSTAQVMSWDHASTTINVNTLYDSADAAAAYNPTDGIAYETEALLGATQGVTAGADGVAVDDLVATIQRNFGVLGVDLDLVKNHGGKIMMWQGTADQLIRSFDSVDYYRIVATHYGSGTADFAGLQPWFRYYHAPGAYHCAPGAGPGPTNIFGQLVGWVENDADPDPVPTSGGSVNPSITPPLCPWPMSAYYNGSGPTNSASSYYCAGDLDANNHALCQMVRTPYGAETSSTLDYSESGITPAECPVPQ